MVFKHHLKDALYILLLIFPSSLCFVNMNIDTLEPANGEQIVLSASTNETAVTWFFKGNQISYCVISTSSCIGGATNMTFTVITTTSYVKISPYNCNENDGVYLVTTLADSDTRTLKSSIPVSSVTWRSSISAVPVESQELSVDIPCVYPTTSIQINFTVKTAGEADEVLQLSSNDIQTTGNAGCVCDAGSVRASYSISYPDKTVQVHVSVLHTLLTNKGFTTLDSQGNITFKGQSTDSCDWTYWLCIIIIWLPDCLVSGICTAVIVRKKKRAKTILCWLADHIFVCCAPWINTYCEDNASTRYRGTLKLLLVAVLKIGIMVSVVVWVVLMIFVICAFCACVGMWDIFRVAFLSLLFSLLAVLLWTAIVFVCCKDGYTHISPSGGTVKLFDKILNPDLKTTSITYTHDGNVVSPANAVCEGGTKECPWLTLRNVSLDQTGEYVCTINFGPSHQEVHKQDILVTPKQNEVQVGDKIELLSFLKDLKKNDNIDSVEWTHNAKVIQTNKCCYKGGNIKNPPLTIKFCTASDSGVYICTVRTKQSLKPKMFSAHLKIKDEIKVDIGGTTTLLQNLNMKNIRDVQWNHEQKPILYKKRYFDDAENRICPALTISLVTAFMAGKYQCIVKYSKDEETKVFEVRVKVIEQYTVDCGDCIDLMNDLSSNHGIKEISWELNGNPLELAENPSYNGGTKDCPVLTIYCATKAEAGKYKCTLTLESQPTKEFNFKLVVNEQLQVDSGESSVLLDKLKSSDNVVSVAWTHNKRPVRYPHKGGTNECPALTIPVVSFEDSGEYECKITLKPGHERLYRLVVKVNVQKIKKKVGDEVTLLQNLKSAGTIKEIDWYKNGEKVRAGKDKTYKGGINQSPGLSVGSLKKHDSGLYKCDLIVQESQIKLHILVDLTVEEEENSTRLGPVIRHHGVRNHDNSAENNQSWTEEE